METEAKPYLQIFKGTKRRHRGALWEHRISSALGGAACSTWTEGKLIWRAQPGSKPAEEPHWRGHNALWEFRGRKGWEQGNSNFPLLHLESGGERRESHPSDRAVFLSLSYSHTNWEDKVECGGIAMQTFIYGPLYKNFHRFLICSLLMEHSPARL